MIRTTIEPDRLRILADRVLVKSYEKPDRTDGGILIPDTVRRDRSWTLWEVIDSGPDVEQVLGARLRPNDIVKTRQTAPVDTGLEDPDDGRPLLLLGADRIYHITRWKEDEDG